MDRLTSIKTCMFTTSSIDFECSHCVQSQGNKTNDTLNQNYMGKDVFRYGSILAVPIRPDSQLYPHFYVSCLGY